MTASSNTFSSDSPADDIDMSAYWMPFTSNRAFKAKPRLFASASGMYYSNPAGEQVMDGMSGLWCCNAGHCHPHIVAAIREQIGTMDYSPAFQMGHPDVFAVASRLAALAPGDLNRVFFTNSGSEAVDTALKITLAVHAARGEGQRTRFIGRERGYHGAGFGGISVGGIGNNRKNFGPLLPGTVHLRHTHDLEQQAFSRGQPTWGAELADDLERVLIASDPSTVAGVIVEPFAGSAGVLVPPVGYLERLRELCNQYGLLLIFDEVITAFGRVGDAFAASRLGVTPDLITIAKGITSGTIPMGGVIVKQGLHDALMQGPESAIELFHGYTYSGHPVASAAALAALDVYENEQLFARSRAMEKTFEDALHGLRNLPHVNDIRNFGLAGAIELASRPDAVGARASEVYQRCLDAGLLVRATGDIIAVAPPLIIEEEQIGFMVDTLRRVIGEIA